MTDENTFYWSFNREKHIRISSRDTYVERLGYMLETEWYLEIKTKFNIDFSYESPLVNAESHFTMRHFPIWRFYLRRSNSSEKVNLNAIFFSEGYETYYCDLILNMYEEIKLIGILDSRQLSVLDFDIAFVFITQEVNRSKVTEKGLSKLKNLSEDFQSMLDKGNRFDVTLKCDTEIIRAHKSILGARSPVFEAMFHINMEENEKDEVVIKDMDPSVLRALVSFIYSGQIKDLNLKFVKDLLYASEKYQISSMKEGCVEYLQSILSNKNVFEILEIGDFYDESLKSRSIRYVCKHFNELKSKEEWQMFKVKKPFLTMEIYSLLEPYIENSP